MHKRGLVDALLKDQGKKSEKDIDKIKDFIQDLTYFTEKDCITPEDYRDLAQSFVYEKVPNGTNIFHMET